MTMARMCANMVLKGSITIDQVPLSIRAEVEKLI